MQPSRVHSRMIVPRDTRDGVGVVVMGVKRRVYDSVVVSPELATLLM